MSNGRVQLAYLHPGKVSHSFHESMMRLVAYDAANNGRIIATQGPYQILTGSVDIPDNRNLGTKRFLDETDHEWMMWIDTDMGFLPDSVDRLVAVADPGERPIVGGLCFSSRVVAYDGYGGGRVAVRPTLFMPARTPDGVVGFKNIFNYPENTVFQVGATGAAFLLIHRGVLEKIRAECGDEWWSMARYDGGHGRMSEDLSFCARAGQTGSAVWVHTGVKTTHHKQMWVSELDYVQPEPEGAP